MRMLNAISMMITLMVYEWLAKSIRQALRVE
jgi:hypothetical protein